MFLQTPCTFGCLLVEDLTVMEKVKIPDHEPCNQKQRAVATLVYPLKFSIVICIALTRKRGRVTVCKTEKYSGT